MESQLMTLTAADWRQAVEGVPELAALENVRDQFKVVNYPGGGHVEPDGFYLVLDGHVSLRIDDDEIAKARRHDYFFEEYLALEDFQARMKAYGLPGTRLLKLNLPNWRTLPLESRKHLQQFMFGDLVNIHLHNFQQPINCCNVTATAFGLTALGFPTHVDDIFRDCDLPTAYVVNSGLTLGEIYDVTCNYIHRRGLKDRVDVQCHYFDEELVTEEAFVNAIRESDSLGGDQDILVANFGVGTAHGNKHLMGGHFSLLGKYNHSTGLIHMVDVHPEKYGKIWITNARRLYRAMVERDGSSLRSRGLLRFSARQAAETKLENLSQTVKFVDMTDHIDLLGKKSSSLFHRTTANLNSLAAAALGIRLLDGGDIDADQFMRGANIPPSEALSYVPTTRQLGQAIQQYLRSHASLSISAEVLEFAELDSGLTEQSWFIEQLSSLEDNGDNQLIINIDINKVLGCEAVLLPGTSESIFLREFWCVCKAYNAESNLVTISDVSSATTQVWQAPAERLFDGLDSRTNPTLIQMTKVTNLESDEFLKVIQRHKLVLFYGDNDAWSYMLQSVLSNIGVTDLHSVNLSGLSDRVLRQKRELSTHSGKDQLPYLYFEGQSMGEVDVIIEMVKSGALQTMLRDAGMHVLMKAETPSLDKNMFGYPKGGLTDAPDKRKNILLCCCGSSAADKIPKLIEILDQAGHDVKLVPSKSAEHFFKDFGMESIHKVLRPSDIYRDDDEWNFRYTQFDMKVRACHLALCDWADCVVVAPITCNSMGKIANGVADNLLSSVFVAWQYQKKPVILCPACNTNMWNNITTQNNVAKLKTLGAHFEGPRSGLLSNGTTGWGTMASVDEIAECVLEALDELENQESRVMKWGAQAAAADDQKEWLKVFRPIDEEVVGVNIRSEETGDTLLHYAAGGEGRMLEHGIEKGVPDLEAAEGLIERGIDVNLVNDFEFSALHVAIMNDSADMVSLLLSAGADATVCVGFAHERDTSPGVLALLDEWAVQNKVALPTAKSRNNTVASQDEEVLYFTYGSLKQGFPNHETHAQILSDCLGTATTRQLMPLVVPHEANCNNPNCPWLHRMPALVNLSGKGNHVQGEVYRMPRSALKELDELESYHGPGHPDNVYERKTVSVSLSGKLVKAYAYFIVDARSQLAAWDEGSADAVEAYTLEMAAVEPKSGLEA